MSDLTSNALPVESNRATKYPFANLAAVMHLTENAAAKQLRLSGSTLKEYRREGMSEKVAERLAVAAGFHPFVVWPEMTEVRCQSVEQECAAEGCDVRFVPARPQSHQKFCSLKCRRGRADQRAKARAAKARYVKGNGAEGNRARRRAYYAANGEYERARQRAYDRAKAS